MRLVQSLAGCHSSMKDFKKSKQEISALTLEMKRQLYQCKTNYVTATQISSWSEFYKENKIECQSFIDSWKVNVSERDSCLDGKEYKCNSLLNGIVSIFCGNIVTLEVDAIVNAANQFLLPGGGVAGAIHTAAGDMLKYECETLGKCSTGVAKLTFGYNLPATHVIQTVGPVGENSEKLACCYKACLEIAVENGFRTIAFPCISTGVYGYPHDPATRVALKSVREFLEFNHDAFTKVIFCLYLEVDMLAYKKFIPLYFPLK